MSRDRSRDLTLAEAAARLGVHKGTLWKWADRGGYAAGVALALERAPGPPDRAGAEELLPCVAPPPPGSKGGRPAWRFPGLGVELLLADPEARRVAAMSPRTRRVETQADELEELRRELAALRARVEALEGAYL